jgi:predicted nucleotidyltransferase
MSLPQLARAQTWPDCDRDIHTFLSSVVALFEEHLGSNLIGVYLHGSLAMGSFYRARSDLDLLVVVADRLGVSARRNLSRALIDLSDERQLPGDLELSVIRQSVLRPFDHPLPFELHFSNSWKEDIRSDRVDYAAERRDIDLAAHCTVARARGVRLAGEPIDAVFPPVPHDSYVDAILADLSWSFEEDHLAESPVYTVLNACRVLAVLREEPEMVLNKEEGGLWGLEHLPSEHHSLIQTALDCYRGPPQSDECGKQTAGLWWDEMQLQDFRDWVLAQVDRSRTSNGEW